VSARYDLSLPRGVARRSPLRSASGYWFIAPLFTLLIVFAAFPLIFSLVIAFNEWNPSSPVSTMRYTGWWGFHYTFTDPYFWGSLWRTLRLALSTILPQHLVALPLAFLINLCYRRVQGQLGTVLFLPFITASAAGAAGAAMLSAFVSPLLANLYELNIWLQSLPNIGPLIPDFTNQQVMTEFKAVLEVVWNNLGFNLLLYLMALSAIPKSLYEAAQLEGTSFWGLLRFVSWPLVRPMVFVAVTMGFLRALQIPIGQWWGQQFDPRSTDLTTYIIRTGFWDFDMGLATALTWGFFLAMVAVVLVFYLLLGRNFTSLDTSAQLEGDASPMRFRPIPKLFLKAALGVLMLVGVLPTLIVFFAATRYGYGGSWFEVGPNLVNNYRNLLEQIPDFWRNLWNSIYVASLGTLGALVCASLAGFAFTMLEFRGRNALYSVVMAVMLFPSLLNLIPVGLGMTAIGWFGQARAVWVPASASAFGVFLMRQYLQTAMPKSMLEAARVDGANDWLIFWKIVLPLIRPVIASLGLLVFVGIWNNTQAAFAVLREGDVQLVTQALGFMAGRQGENGTLLLGLAISSLPPLIVFALFGSQLAAGLGLGGASKPAFSNLLSNLLARWRNADSTPVSSTPAPSTPAPSTPALSTLAPSTLAGADGIRAIACLMVILHHLAQRLEMQPQVPIVRDIQAFLMQGSAGVSAFFVLSGLLLSLPFWRRYLEQKSFPDLLEYTRRRAVRIVPGFYASLLVSVALGLALVPETEKPWMRLIGGLSFTSALNYVTLFPAEINGPLWSIGFEVICYFLMPLGMYFLFKYFPARGFGFAFRFWLGLLALTLLVNQFIVTELVPDAINRGWDHGLVGGAKYWMPNYNVIGFFAHYALGVLAAGLLAFRQRHTREVSYAFDGLAMIGLIGMIGLMWAGRSWGDFDLGFQGQPYRYPLFALCIALLLVTLPFSRVLGPALDNRFFKYTAKISFGLYIWHYLILELIRLLHNSDFHYNGIRELPYLLLLSTITLGLAYVSAAVSYRHIESPFFEHKNQHKPHPESRENQVAVSDR
jgi:ABC-type glycerol-3-phosphate transport system permease component/peptidoglycan/LPS O-acetylase OafA/YrhL